MTRSVEIKPVNKILSTIKKTADTVDDRKSWYVYRENGSFDWMAGVGNLERFLDMPKDLIENAIVTAFTPKSLSRVKIINKEGKEESVPFLQALNEEGIEFYIWTVGDLPWQRKKLERTGIYQFTDQDHIKCCGVSKMESLDEILQDEERKNDSEKKHVMVADDKEKNIDKVKELGHKYKKISLNTFKVDLHNLACNVDILFERIMDLKEKVGRENILLVLDFDGVSVDTHGTMVDEASKNLAALIDSK